jgi:hypothetical protein
LLPALKVFSETPKPSLVVEHATYLVRRREHLMRRITVIGMIILGLVALPLMAAAKSDKTPDKIEICHVDEDGETRTIEVSEKAEAAHLAHGDEAGPCADPTGAELPVLTAEFTGSVTCGTGFFFMICDLSLDSTGSSGDIASYEWTYATGDDAGIAYGPTAKFEDLSKGTTAEVTLTVTSTAGDSTSTTQSILILATNP